MSVDDDHFKKLELPVFKVVGIFVQDIHPPAFRNRHLLQLSSNVNGRLVCL